MAAAIPIAAYPPQEVRRSLPESQWAAILTSWVTALTVYLRLPDTKFAAALSPGSSLVEFLRSYVTHESEPVTSEDARRLRKKAFLVFHRALSVPPFPEALLADGLLLPLAGLYHRVPAFRKLISAHDGGLEKALVALKASLLGQIERGSVTITHELNLARLFVASPAAAALFLAGDDFVEALANAGGAEQQSRIYGRALVSASTRNWSVVVDGLYALVTAAELDKSRPEARMIKSLVEYGIIARLAALAEEAQENRIPGVVGRMSQFGTSKKHKKAGRAKGKGKAADHGFGGEKETELISKVTAIKELFPDLADAVVTRTLEVHGGDVEAVIQAILEDSLPLRSELASTVSYKGISHRWQPAPRRNKYDNDELDNLTPAALEKLSLGPKNFPQSIDTLPGRVDKSTVLSALAAFDLDEDERDDTYDLADVGGAVDTSGPPGEEDMQSNIRSLQNVDACGVGDTEKTVYEAWKCDQALFSRDAATRRSEGRKKLREETGWTDEALEGWAVILQREPGRAKQLERTYQDADSPRQTELRSTRWRADDNESEGGAGNRDLGRGRGRGGGRGSGRGRGRSGDESGPPPDPARGRRRNEQNKSSRANHNRKDQRARKVARGGFAG